MPDGRAGGETWDERFRKAYAAEIDSCRNELGALAAEARAGAAWWQAQCQGRDAVIAELNRRVDDLIGSQRRWLESLERRVGQLEKQAKAGATVASGVSDGKQEEASRA